ncbi:hypothetical protein ACFYUY_01540 [Kitasatospora sp. NPDC004745]|uniref:hypothetical protein n=1 Tax=Kitasatospora sp. NPDC004745 TaxID=3364019 RepID=UPI003695EFB0
MTVTATAEAPRVTAGLITVTLPDDGPAMRATWITPDTVIVGFDPRYLTEDLVVMVLQSVHGDGISFVEGVPQ